MAFALTITTVVKDEYVDTQPMQQRNPGETVSNVPRISMKNQKRAACTFTGNKPSVQPQVIFRDKGKILVREAEIARIPGEFPRREIDKEALQPVRGHNQHHSDDQ